MLHGFNNCRDPAVWGFPIDSSVIIANFKRTTPDDERLQEIAKYSPRVSGELRKKCRRMWSSPAGMLSTPVQVYSSDNSKIIIALIRSTCCEDTFLPPQDKVEELKAVLTAEGFTEEPDWFIWWHTRVLIANSRYMLSAPSKFASHSCSIVAILQLGKTSQIFDTLFDISFGSSETWTIMRTLEEI